MRKNSRKKENKTLAKLNDGKFFEMVVECLQRLLSTEGLTVTPSRKFYDDKGNQVGEVDVVIEGLFESQKIMVGVECRDRKSIPGVEWIQQIIGRRISLAKFGFTHWIAVSRKGFAKTAIDLAREHKIALLIPAKVTPVDQNKPGFHTFMELSLTYSHWIPDKFNGTLFWDDEKISSNDIDIIESELKTKAPNVNNLGLKPIPLIEFLKPIIDDFDKEELKAISKMVHTFKFDDLDAEFNGRFFKFKDFTISVEFHRKKIKPDFQIMAFAIPDNEKIEKKILGIIGINEYKSDLDIAYMLVGIKPDNPRNFVFFLRDSKGKPITNREVNLQIPSLIKKH